MVRADRIALAAVGLLTKAALGLLGLALLIGWDAPRPRPGPAAPGQPDDATMMKVSLRLPEGALAGHLTVVDESGRELATLALWAVGMTTVVSRNDTIVVSTHLNADGSVRTRMAGPALVTVVEAGPDGTRRVSHRDASTGFEVSSRAPLGGPAGLDIHQGVRAQCDSVIEGPRGFHQGSGVGPVDPRGG
jgi:hypothetical protein